MESPETCQDSEIRQMHRSSKRNYEAARVRGGPRESDVPGDKRRMLFKKKIVITSP